MQIGAQLYSAHKRLQTLEDFDAGLKKVAEIGYRTVQVSGTCPYEPEWLRDTLQKHNLTCCITHINPERIVNETEKVVAEHKIFGCTHIGIGGMPGPMRKTIEGYEAFRDQFLPAAQKIRDLGAKLHYHNHWFEFNELEGKQIIQRILEDFPADVLDFTLDLGWAAYGGADVLALIRQMEGRLSCIHLKDYADPPADGSIEPAYYLRPVFEGKLPYEDYIQALKNTDCEYMLVEQDTSYSEDEFECLRRSYVNVTTRFPEVK